MERSSVENKYKWKIEDIFASDEEWENYFKETEKYLDFKHYEGTLTSAENVAKMFRAQEEASIRIERLHLYAHMRHDEDSRASEYTSMQSRSMSLYVQFSSAISFVDPELTALPAEILQSFATDKRLSDYDYYFRQLIRGKEHILSANEEKILAMGGEVYSQFHEIFGMIDNADIKLGCVTDADGNEIPLTHGMYGVILHGEDRELRKKAFEAYYDAYISLKNTIAATYFGNVKKDVFLSRARNYSSCLERALDGEDVNVVVYKNLLDSVDASLPSMHRYIRDRKKIMKLDEQHVRHLRTPRFRCGNETFV